MSSIILPPRYRGKLSFFLYSILFQTLAISISYHGAMYHLASYIKHFLYCCIFFNDYNSSICLIFYIIYILIISLFLYIAIIINVVMYKCNLGRSKSWTWCWWVEISGSEVNILWLSKPAAELCSKRDVSFVLQPECMIHYHLCQH